MDPFLLIFMVLAVGGLFWMNSRAKKQQRAQGAFRDNLQVGQEVMTGSGLFGVITSIDDDVITLASTPGNESRWLRAAISKVVEPPVEDDADEDEIEDITAPDGGADTTGDRGFLSPEDLRKPYREGEGS